MLCPDTLSSKLDTRYKNWYACFCSWYWSIPASPSPDHLKPMFYNAELLHLTQAKPHLTPDQTPTGIFRKNNL